jgi:hypothetical protein
MPYFRHFAAQFLTGLVVELGDVNLACVTFLSSPCDFVKQFFDPPVFGKVEE